MGGSAERPVDDFRRRSGGVGPGIHRIGAGEIGGKAAGLVFLRDEVVGRIDTSRFDGLSIDVPPMSVLGTQVFEAFVERNDLDVQRLSGRADAWIAHVFQRANLPPTVVGDLHALIRGQRRPLAVRSSSRLEDALAHPFAGVYGTKMLPNDQIDSSTRFRRLLEAIKYVYGTTWSAAARSYHASLGHAVGDESMAVVLQEVVGRRHGDRYYPDLSGVARSWNPYPLPGCEPEDGVVSLALGLGRQIVDGGLSWTYCPRRPRVQPPWTDVADRARNTQTTFWAVNMGPPPAHDPTRETEYLVELDLARAEDDGRIDRFVSSWDRANDRLRPGRIGPAGTPRVLDFAPLLQFGDLPFNDLVLALIEAAREASGAEVELEFAATFGDGPRDPAHLSVLQLRPMAVQAGSVEVDEAELHDPRAVVASTSVLGDGDEELHDVVFVEPEGFDRSYTRDVATELATINDELVREGRSYVLVGFGRWGSSDPWLGIPVVWGQISGVKVLVEASLEELSADPSQGSHFFHNLMGRGAMMLTVPRHQGPSIDWERLRAMPEIRRTHWCRHVRSSAPLRVRVDGRRRRGVVLSHE